MKRILILAYDFPPYVSVGALRPHSWYKYLNEFGYFPIVVTRQWGNKHASNLDYIEESESNEIITEESEHGIVIRVPYKPNFPNRLILKYGTEKYKLIRKLCSAFYEYAQYLFFIGTKTPLYFAAKNYLIKNKVDAIIASGEPFILFKYASELSKKYNIPWLADYRDFWSQSRKNRENLFHKYFYSSNEKKYLSTAAGFTTVSDFLVKGIIDLIGTKQSFVVPNGCDTEHFKDLRLLSLQAADELNIAFTGTIYSWQPIKSFLHVLHQYVKKKPEAKIKFNVYGLVISYNFEEMISNEFEGLKNYIKIYPKLQYSLLIKELARNNVMLLFNNYSIMGTKIYDYIGINRKILLCYSDDEESIELRKMNFENISAEKEAMGNLQEKLITETDSGIIVKDKAHLNNVLENLMTEFEMNKLIQCDSKGIENFSRRTQTKKMAMVLDEIL